MIPLVLGVLVVVGGSCGGDDDADGEVQGDREIADCSGLVEGAEAAPFANGCVYDGGEAPPVPGFECELSGEDVYVIETGAGEDRLWYGRSSDVLSQGTVADIIELTQNC